MPTATPLLFSPLAFPILPLLCPHPRSDQWVKVKEDTDAEIRLLPSPHIAPSKRPPYSRRGLGSKVATKHNYTRAAYGILRRRKYLERLFLQQPVYLQQGCINEEFAPGRMMIFKR